jgi:ribosome-associated toxin RatA of RatAB toxin-antitoxin module
VPQEYEQSQPIDAAPEEVFAWLSDVGNPPEYLPPVVASSVGRERPRPEDQGDARVPRAGGGANLRR